MIDVVAALVREGERFLICQRPRDKKRGLLWEFPGGKVEPGESHAQALMRECREELAVEVAVGDLYFTAEHVYPDIHIRLCLYEAHIVRGALDPREHEATAWITPEEIGGYDFCPADVDILAELKRRG